MLRHESLLCAASRPKGFDRGRVGRKYLDGRNRELKRWHTDDVRWSEVRGKLAAACKCASKSRECRSEGIMQGKDARELDAAGHGYELVTVLIV